VSAFTNCRAEYFPYKFLRQLIRPLDLAHSFALFALESLGGVSSIQVRSGLDNFQVRRLILNSTHEGLENWNILL
jgi:hypothetical protein